MKPNLLKNEFKGMEDLATAVLACDKNLVIKYINPSAEILFELSYDQAFNESISLFFEEIYFFKDALKSVCLILVYKIYLSRKML